MSEEKVYFPESGWRIRVKISDGNTYFVKDGVPYRLVDEAGYADQMEMMPLVCPTGGFTPEGLPTFKGRNPMGVKPSVTTCSCSFRRPMLA